MYEDRLKMWGIKWGIWFGILISTGILGIVLQTTGGADTYWIVITLFSGFAIPMSALCQRPVENTSPEKVRLTFQKEELERKIADEIRIKELHSSISALTQDLKVKRGENIARQVNSYQEIN